MNKYFRLIKQNLDKIYRLVMLFVAIALIALMFPNIASFAYEYQKAKPWMHETYIAPFDFAIYKTKKELNIERDSILKNYKPYFMLKEVIAVDVFDQLAKQFNDKWSIYETSSDMDISEEKLQTYKKIIYKSLHENIKYVYSKGLVDFADNNYIDNVSSIFIVRNNLATEYNKKDLYNVRTAYIEIKKSITLDSRLHEFKSFVQNLNIASFLRPNLEYNGDMSEKIKTNMISNISLTRGMVQAGERVVSAGEIIDDSTFRILESLKKEYENALGSSHSRYLIQLGQLFLIAICLSLLYFLLNSFRNNIFNDSRKVFFILMLIIMLVAASVLVLQFAEKFPSFFNMYMIPFTIIPIMIRTFMDSRTALFSYLITILIVSFLAPNSFEFIFLQMIAGIVSLLSLSKLERRGQLILTASAVFLAYSLVYFSFAIMQEGSVQEIEYRFFAWFAVNALFLTLVYPLVYIFEKLFGFLSDISLIELSNPNHPLLREMTRRTPGTFQHSLQVANLAEAAIYEIGGNPLLVRTGALYHDIGKMNNPVYFIENQASNVNPHNKLEFDKSAEIITDHVKYGIKVAKKNKLPQQIIDFIATHHGAGKVMYFYNSFKNKYPDREIDEEKFTYPGPDPFSKETAVLMMADAIEASSRSLPEKSPQAIEALVNKIIDGQVNGKRFDNADISFKNIKQIKKIFTQMLINIYHARIAYPDAKK